MDILYKIFIDPFVQMGTSPDLLVQTLWDGLVAGVLYALIALGFVLIFKASGVFNFAQGIMVVFAALTLVGLHEHGVPAFVALALTIVVMFVLAYGVERLMLRPLVNQSDIILFMATFGLTYFLIGARPARVRRQSQSDDHVRTLPSARRTSNSRRSAVSFRCRRSISPRSSSPRSWSRCSRSSFSAPASGGRCARSPTAIRPRSRSASRSNRFG